jgi:hypothetical protein
MKFGFHCNSALLFAAFVAMSSTNAQADDKPATARKPLVLLTDAAKNKPKTDVGVELVQSVAIDPTGRYLFSTVQTASPRTLGVAVTPADPVLRANVPATKGKLGLVVTSVVKDSPAAKARIHTGDILLTLAAKDLATVSDLTVAVQKAKSPADASLVRAGKTLMVRVRFPEPAKTDRNLAGAYDYLVRVRADAVSKYTIGVSTKQVDATLASQLVLPPSTGAIITSVAKDSAAAKAGLQQHDVILTVADQYVSSAWDLGKALDKAAGKPVKIEFLRSGRKQSCTVTPTKRPPVHGVGVRFWKLQSGQLMRTARFYNQDLQWQMKDAWFRDADTLKMRRSTDLNSQVDRLSKQVDELKKTLDALKQQLPARKTKVKTTKSK